MPYLATERPQLEASAQICHDDDDENANSFHEENQLCQNIRHLRAISFANLHNKKSRFLLMAFPSPYRLYARSSRSIIKH